MELEARKIEFVQEFLRLQNEEIVSGLEKLLRKRKIELIEKNLQPMSMKQYEAEIDQAMEDSKSDIGWGHQIRSYVLDQSRIKDLRTNCETGNTQSVLDGDLDEFIEASLKQGVK